jgi:hypothetical protein
VDHELLEETMKDDSTRRQRPLFHDGPDWQRLDQQLQHQLVGRLTDICHGIVSMPVNLAINEQEQPNDDQHD